MIDYKYLTEQFKQPFGTWDNLKRGSLILNVILLLLLGAGIYSYNANCGKGCDGEIVRIVHDTIRPKDEPKIIYADRPTPKKTTKIKPKDNVTPIQVVTVEKLKRDTITLTIDNACDYLTTYKWDTVIKDQAHITINEEVVGYVNWRSIEYANLTPQVTTTITKVRTERVKCYLGIAGTFNGNVFKQWGVGPQGFIAIPRIGGVSYYYDAHNNAHTAGFLALIRFKK